MSIPVSDRVDFLRRKSRKYEMRILGLPSYSLSFIQGELQHAFMRVQGATSLGENRILGLPDLREYLSEKSQAEQAQPASTTHIHPNLIRLFRFHILICLSLYVITVITY